MRQLRCRAVVVERKQFRDSPGHAWTCEITLCINHRSGACMPPPHTHPSNSQASMYTHFSGEMVPPGWQCCRTGQAPHGAWHMKL